jgi:hypothetical protein
MKKVMAIVTALVLSSSMAYAADDATVAPQDAQPSTAGTTTPGKEAGQPTSNRTPGKETPTPLGQTTQTDGATSDRTPSNHTDADKK